MINYTTYWSSTDATQHLILNWGTQSMFNDVKQCIELYVDNVERNPARALTHRDIITIGKRITKENTLRNVSYKDTYPIDEIEEKIKVMTLFSRKTDDYYKAWANEMMKIRPFRNYNEVVIGTCIAIMSKVSKDNYWTIR